MLINTTKPSLPKRAMFRATALGLTVVLFPPATSAQNAAETNEKKKEKGAFPTLNILPEGSILRRVRLPRYDKDFNPTSLLAAEQLTVLDSYRIEGEGVTIELYEQDGSLQAKTKMRRAIYDRKNSTIEAKEAIYLKGTNYVASGSGLIFNWKSEQGFINGPTSTRFHFKKATAMNFPSPRQLNQSASIASALLISSPILMATPPMPLTSEQLAVLEQHSQSTQPQTDAARSEIQQHIQTQTQLAESSRKQITPFLKSIGKDTLLIQNPTPPIKPTEGNANSTDNKTNLQPGESTLLVECDGGLYFNNDVGILAYLKNIRLTEDRFQLTCRDELKVLLDQKPIPAKDGTIVEEKPDDKKSEPISAFGDIKQIIATGDVQVTRLDEQGRRFSAMAETASYDAKTGEIILRGGRPRLQQSANQYLQAQEPGQWVRILKNGKLVTSKGKWKMVAVLKNR